MIQMISNILLTDLYISQVSCNYLLINQLFLLQTTLRW